MRSHAFGMRSNGFGMRSNGFRFLSDAFRFRSDWFGRRSDACRLRADAFGMSSDGFRFRSQAFGRRIRVLDYVSASSGGFYYAKTNRFSLWFLKRNGVDCLIFGTVRAVFALDQTFEAFGAVADIVFIEIKNPVARDAVTGKIGGGFD